MGGVQPSIRDPAMPSIVAASTPLYAEPEGTGGRETDCLFGEAVEVHGERGGWSEVTLETDGYRGWLRASALGKLPAPSHRVVSPGPC